MEGAPLRIRSVAEALRRGVGVALLIGIVCTCMQSARAEALSRADHIAHQRQIHADFEADRVACERLTDQDKRICVVKARSRESVALAELAYNVSGTDADAARLATVRGESDHTVARAICAGRPMTEKERCLQEADAARTRALPDGRARTGIRR